MEYAEELWKSQKKFCLKIQIRTTQYSYHTCPSFVGKLTLNNCIYLKATKPDISLNYILVVLLTIVLNIDRITT